MRCLRKTEAPLRAASRAFGWLLGGVFAIVVSMPAHAFDIVSGEIRTALVIGNATYRTAPLRNPVNDAQAVATALKGLGFSVILRENASLAHEIENKVRAAMEIPLLPGPDDLGADTAERKAAKGKAAKE